MIKGIPEYVSIPLEDDYFVLVEGTYWPATPGKISGPPEDCYPPDPSELEMISAWLCDKDGKKLFDLSTLEIASTTFLDMIYQKAYEELDERYEDAKYSYEHEDYDYEERRF